MSSQEDRYMFIPYKGKDRCAKCALLDREAECRRRKCTEEETKGKPGFYMLKKAPFGSGYKIGKL